MKKILHFTSGLDSGGAEKILIDIAKKDILNDHYIISFKDYGIYKNVIERNKIKVKYFNISKLNFIFKLPMILIYAYKIKPNIVITWMYHADLIGGLIAKLLFIKRVYWNIRNSTLDISKTKRLTLVVLKICSKFSHFIPDKIISCSEKAIQHHIEAGYKNVFYLIPNGVDIEEFKNLNLEKKNDIICLGYVGRWHPQKNYEFFFECLSELKNKFNYYKFKVLMAGNSINQNNSVLVNLIKKNGLTENILLLDEIEDMVKFYNSIDLNVLTSSYGEAFPNVIAEAMSCETPCLSTEIGDVKNIMGDLGWIIKQNDKEKFCKNIIEAFDFKTNYIDKWIQLKQNCRSRIISNYSQHKMIQNYNKLFNN